MFATLLHHISQYKAKGDGCGSSRNRKQCDYSGLVSPSCFIVSTLVQILLLQLQFRFGHQHFEINTSFQKTDNKLHKCFSG